MAEYVKTEKLSVVRKIQQEILIAYERDFSKHAPSNKVMKITAVWEQIHRQLAKENKKFVFAAIRKSARGRDYEEAIQWLADAGLIHKSYRVECPKFPLSAYENREAFKVFLLDVGLLGAQSELSPQALLGEKSPLFRVQGSSYRKLHCPRVDCRRTSSFLLDKRRSSRSRFSIRRGERDLSS